MILAENKSGQQLLEYIHISEKDLLGIRKQKAGLGREKDIIDIKMIDEYMKMSNSENKKL